jgi:hypothetical protein
MISVSGTAHARQFSQENANASAILHQIFIRSWLQINLLEGSPPA